MRRLMIVLSIAAGCGDDGGGVTAPGDSGTTDTPSPACVREPAPADRPRYVVVSHPYTANAMQSDAWEVLELSAAGELSRPGRTFTMGRGFVGEVAFTPDGEIGVAPQEDGTLGIFRLDAEGVPTVLHARFQGAFYAKRVVTGPDGAIYVLDTQWRENGGGIYRLDIDCDDTVRDAGLVAAAKLPAGLAFVPGTSTAVVAAADIAMSPAGAEAHLMTWGATPSHTASTDVFPDDEAIVGGATLAGDGQFFLIGDVSAFASVPNRVAVVPVTSSGFGQPEIIPDLEDPLALVADPAALQVLAVSGFGNAMFVLDRPTTTWRVREVVYDGASPKLPSGAVLIERGALAGHVLVAELSGVRHVRFVADGVEDLGLFSLGGGNENTTGVIGVTP